MSSTKSHCALCGEVIGVYEPAVLLARAGDVVRASGLTLGEDQDGVPMHESCYKRTDTPAASGSS